MNEEQLEQQLRNLPRFHASRMAVVKFYVALMARRLSARISRAFTRNTAVFAKFATAAAFALVITAGVGTYAYASPSVTRGDALYPVKTSIEHARFSLSPTPLGRVRAYSTQALHRLGEAETLSREGYGATHELLGFLPVPVAYAESGSDEAQDDEDDPLAQTIREMITAMRSALQESETIAEPKKLEKALNIVGAAHAKQRTRLREIASTVGPKAKEAAILAVAEALEETEESGSAVESARTIVQEARSAEKKSAMVRLIRKKTTSLEPSDLEVKRQKIADLRAGLAEEGIDPLDAEKLMSRLNARLDKVQRAIDSGNAEQAAGLLKSVDALMNNARHFFKEGRKIQQGDSDGAVGSASSTKTAPPIRPKTSASSASTSFTPKQNGELKAVGAATGTINDKTRVRDADLKSGSR